MTKLTLIRGDALKVLSELEDENINLVLTDPPYGIDVGKMPLGLGGGIAKSIDYGKYTWDEIRLSEDYFKEIFRKSKNQIIFGGNYYTDCLPPRACWIVWDKKGDMPSIDFADCELIWTSFNSPSRIFKYLWRGMLQEDMKRKEKRLHPTQKPLPLMKWILNKYSDENDLILDPFLGSGTTMKACLELNRNCIGIEISKKYINIIKKRLNWNSSLNPDIEFEYIDYSKL